MRRYRLNSSIALWLSILLLICTTASAETYLSGYFEPQLSVYELGGNYYQLNSNKLRIDLHSDISESIIFKGNFDYINYNGQTNYDLVDYLPRSITGMLPPGFDSIPFGYSDTIFLDNAYLRIYSGQLTTTIGRLQFSYGSGFAWNPTDLFNKINILDPTYEQPGVDGIRFDFGLGSAYSICLLYSPERNWDKSGKLVRFLGRVSHFDWSLSVGEITLEKYDLLTNRIISSRRNMLGFDFSGELFGLGCHSENGYNYIRKGVDYWENLVGIDYTFTSGWYILLEYYHNQRADSDKDDYDLTDWLDYLTSESKTITRDQLYYYTYYLITDFVNIGGSVIYSISDKSSAIIPMLDYSMSDNLNLTILGNINTGADGTIYSRHLGNGVLFRLRAYF